MRLTTASRLRRWVVAATVLALALAAGWELGPVSARAAAGPTRVLLLLDVSGSMNDHISSGGTKFAAAKRALKQVAATLPPGTQVGLRVYGSTISQPKSRNPAACTDSTLVLPIGPLDQAKMTRAVDSFTAKGETPIAYSLQRSVDDLGPTGKRVLVLISDGQETCQRDPCPTARKLAKSGVDLQFNAVGLAVNQRARKQLQCIVDAGNGSYYDASRASELSEAIRKITQRALRPFAVTGTPVTGTLARSDAPEIASGQYTDRYDTSDTKRFYRISRTPGSTVTASVASIVSPYDLVNTETWHLELFAVSGESCGRSSVGSSVYRGTTVVSGGVASTAREPIASGSTDPCTAGPLTLALSRGSTTGTKAPAPVEILIQEEPAISNEAGLPASLTSYDGQGRAVAAQQPVRPALGGTSYSNAATLTPGSWSDSPAAGETTFYRVQVATGQRLRVTVQTPAPKSGWALQSAEAVSPEIRLYAPSRVQLARDYAVLLGHQQAALTLTTPQVRVRNRYSPTVGLYPDALRAASVAGYYYLALAVDPVQSALSGRVMPVRINVAVDGRPSGQPVYTLSSASPSQTNPSAAQVSPTAAASATSSPSASVIAAPPTAAPAGPHQGFGGVVLGVAAVAAALVAGAAWGLRRRAKRP